MSDDKKDKKETEAKTATDDGMPEHLQDLATKAKPSKVKKETRDERHKRLRMRHAEK